MPWSKGLPLVWDFSCVDTMAPSRISLRNITAAQDGEIRKATKYRELEECYHFHAIVGETIGGWGPQSFHFLKSLGKLLTSKLCEPRAGYYLRQRLSIAIARGNCASVYGTMECVATQTKDAELGMQT